MEQDRHANVRQVRKHCRRRRRGNATRDDAHGKPAQANAQLPLDSHHAFRPGKQVLIDIGARWDATDKLG